MRGRDPLHQRPFFFAALQPLFRSPGLPPITNSRQGSESSTEPLDSAYHFPVQEDLFFSMLLLAPLEYHALRTAVSRSDEPVRGRPPVRPCLLFLRRAFRVIVSPTDFLLSRSPLRSLSDLLPTLESLLSPAPTNGRDCSVFSPGRRPHP